MAPAQFDAEIQESGNAPNALANYAQSYGINPHLFSEPLKFTAIADGHSVQGYSAATTSSGGFQAAAPGEESFFVQIILPLSYTQGSFVRDYTFFVVRNLDAGYLILDNGEGGSVRVDATDPYDPGTYTYQWFWNGEPVDPPNFIAAGISANCWFAIATGIVIPTIGAIFVTTPAGAAFFFLGKMLGGVGVLAGCGCDLGTFPRCN